jgi:hypothetical protein
VLSPSKHKRTWGAQCYSGMLIRRRGIFWSDRSKGLMMIQIVLERVEGIGFTHDKGLHLILSWMELIPSVNMFGWIKNGQIEF